MIAETAKEMVHVPVANVVAADRRSTSEGWPITHARQTDE